MQKFVDINLKLKKKLFQNYKKTPDIHLNSFNEIYEYNLLKFAQLSSLNTIFHKLKF